MDFQNIEGITFDAANTLIYTNNWTRDWKLMSDYLVNQRYDIYPQELEAARQYVFFHDLPLLNLDNWQDWTLQIFKRLETEPDQDTVDGLIKYLRRISDSFELFDEVAKVMTKLCENYRLSVVTTIPFFKLENAFEPIIDCFEIVVHGGNAGCVKGNPKMYQYDLDKKNIDAENNLFIGDDPYYDIKIPKLMGQNTVFLNRDGSKHCKNADYTITSLTGLLSLIN